jgi:hypothetical protein
MKGNVNSYLIIPELQTIMVEGVANPCIAQPIGRQALIVLAPDFFIFKVESFTQDTRQIPC